MYRAAVAKTHFGFRRVNVHIDTAGRHIKEQHIRRVTLMVQHIGVGGANGVADHLVAHITLVHIRILRVGARPRRIGGKNHAREVELTRSLVHPNTMFGQGVRQYIRDAIFPVSCWIVCAHFILVKQFKRAMRARQSNSGEYF